MKKIVGTKDIDLDKQIILNGNSQVLLLNGAKTSKTVFGTLLNLNKADHSTVTLRPKTKIENGRTLSKVERY